MILIWTPYKTQRLIYVFDYVFNTLLGLKYAVTTNRSDYETYQGVKFCYSASPVQDENWIYAHNLLIENEIKTQNIKVEDDPQYIKIFFRALHSYSLLPFDLFAATFYLISRYEEYLPFSPDKHNRFPYTQSIAYKHQFLQIPLINVWTKEFYKLLSEKFNLPAFKASSFSIIPTFDIDNFYAFKGKSFVRSLLALINAIRNKRGDLVKLRLQYIFNKISDPYDTYDYIITFCKKYSLEPIFFILSSKTSLYDTNISYQHPLFIETTKKLNQSSNIGIHLSYSSLEWSNVQNEKQQLESIIEKPITSNRFHFLRFRLPNAYIELVKCGISSDFSMGYPDVDGFRASTCVPFQFYDLTSESITPLTIYPFPFMDRYIIQSDDAYGIIDTYLKYYKQYGGTLVLLWHNETLQLNHYWIRSRELFEYVLKKAADGV